MRRGAELLVFGGAVLAVCGVPGAAPALAQDAQPACSVTMKLNIEGAPAARAEAEVETLGLQGKQMMFGYYLVAVPAAGERLEDAPASATFQVKHIAEGADTGLPGTRKGFQSLVVQFPDIEGTATKVSTYRVKLSAGPVELGWRNVAPEGNVLFLTGNHHRSNLNPNSPTYREDIVHLADLDKALSMKRFDLTATLLNKAGTPIGTYTLTKAVMKAANEGMYDGYGEIFPKWKDGTCKPGVAL